MSYTRSQRSAFAVLTALNTGVVALLITADVPRPWLVLYAALLPVGFRLLILASEQADPFRALGALRIRRALRRGEIVLHYQPKVTIGDERLVGVEALARWEHPRRGTLAPAEWIDAISHLWVRWPFTCHVLNEAVSQAARWRAEGLDLVVCVNVSPDSFEDRRLVRELRRLLSEHELPASRICVEMTETALEGSGDATAAAAAELNELGLIIALDDFGVGHSSMERLVGLPVRELKIDRRFVANMTHSRADRAVVMAATQLGRNLGIGVVAEGVETPATLMALRAAGCQVAQGFLYSRALPRPELEEFARRFSRRSAPDAADSASAAAL